MPEYSDENIVEWMNTCHKVYGVVEPWNNANLIANNGSFFYMKGVLMSALNIPENLRDEQLKKKISILEEAVKIHEEKNKNL